jgi:hypothetical protein
MHSQWQTTDRPVWPMKPGAFTQAEDELILHALQRLGSALPSRSEAEIAGRLTLMAQTRTSKGIAV